MAKVESLGEKTKAEQQQEDISEGSLDTPQWTKEEEDAVRRKLDWQVVPTVTVLYLLCFLDR